MTQIPTPTDIGCDSTVKLDGVTLTGPPCSAKSTTFSTASSSAAVQTGNGGIVHGSSTLGGNAVSTVSSGHGTGAHPTGLAAMVVGACGAAAVLIV